MIRLSKSLFLIWRLAELEALHLKKERIRPAHFFLGILKVVELDLGKILADTPKQDFIEIQRDITELRNCIGEFILDTTYTRRFLRGILPTGNGNLSKERLHRSDAARILFGNAEALAQKNGSPVLPIHLLLALLESDSPQIRTAFEKIRIDIGDFKKYVAIFAVKSRR